MSEVNSTARSMPLWRLEVSVDRLFDAVVWSVLAAIAFFNLTSLDPEKSSVGLDVYVALKLMLTGVAGLIGLYGLVSIPRTSTLLISPPGLWLTGLGIFFAISSLTSVSPLESMASTFAYWSILLFTVTALVSLGPVRVVRAVAFGIGAYLVGSWFAYLMIPSLGVHLEPIPGGEFVSRMAGLSHPNVLGQYSGLAIGLVLVLFAGGHLRSRWWWAVVGLAAAALAFSISRASTIALVLALIFSFRKPVIQRIGMLGFLALGTLAIGTLLVASVLIDFGPSTADNLLASFAKSGEADEVTTMTGRTEIWAYAVDRIQQRPWTGYGLATSKEVLRDYSHYTHNLWLNIAFACGLPGLICLAVLTIGRIVDSVLRPSPVIDFVIAFIFINGCVENVVFSFIPAAPTMLLVVAVLWRINDSIDQRENEKESPPPLEQMD